MRSSDTAPPAIRIDGLVCEAGGRVILEVPHLVIAHGEKVAIVGPNGAGKTTLMRCLSGFVVPTRGEVAVLGTRVHGSAPATSAELRRLRSSVGQVLQGLHLVPRLTAIENVLAGLLGRRSGWRTWTRCFAADDIAEAQQHLQRVGMADRARTRSDRLSGGERQRVATARMLMQQPSLVLADEPTASLDPRAAAELVELLIEVATRDVHPACTLLTVVHTPSLLPALADRVIGLSSGRVLFDVPTGDVDSTSLARLYGSSPGPAIASVPELRPSPAEPIFV